jgi:diguanylate cyclase (GGDEF)-like protein
MFRRTPKAPESEPAAAEVSIGDMAVDALAHVLRGMADFPLEQDTSDIPTFRAAAEAWAKHVTLATPAPGTPVTPAPATPGDEESKSSKGKREWEGLRRFVRDYLQSSCRRAIQVTGDLRQVIWVFIRHINQAFADDEQTDERLRMQLGRLEKMVADNSSTADLKLEVLDAVGMLKHVIAERSERQQRQMQILGAQVRSLGSELESARAESETDPLTRIPNRKAFDEYLARSVEIHQAFGDRMSLLIVDVDHLKDVNDAYGHVTGDTVLRRVADALVKVFLRKNDFVSRLGGDEFAVILRETSPDDATALGERVLNRIHALHITDEANQELRISVSIGLGQIAPGDDGKAWIERADRGLHIAKDQGRDRVARAS